MNKWLIFVSIFGLLFLSMGHLQAKRRGSALCEPRVPAVNLDGAIKLTQASHRVHSDKEIFIVQAILECENKIYTWHIGYRLKAYESGRLMVKVLMDGTVKPHGIVKDG